MCYTTRIRIKGLSEVRQAHPAPMATAGRRISDRPGLNEAAGGVRRGARELQPSAGASRDTFAISLQGRDPP